MMKMTRAMALAQRARTEHEQAVLSTFDGAEIQWEMAYITLQDPHTTWQCSGEIKSPLCLRDSHIRRNVARCSAQYTCNHCMRQVQTVGEAHARS